MREGGLSVRLLKHNLGPLTITFFFSLLRDGRRRENEQIVLNGH